jgi:primosomal protein N'
VWVARRFPRQVDVFDYAIPAGVHVNVGTGVRVLLRGKPHRGVVVGFSPLTTLSPRKLLPLHLDRQTQQPLCTVQQIEFLTWLANETLTSPGSLLTTALPPDIERVARRGRRLAFGTIPQAASKQLPARVPASLFISITGQRERAELIHELFERSTVDRPVLVLSPTIEDVLRWVAILPANAASEIAIVHHAMSRSAQFGVYQLVASGKIRFILGTRKALFLPYKKLRIVAVDLEEDSSHDQSQQNPRFILLPVAQRLAKITGAKFISWGYSPRLSTYHALGKRQRSRQRLSAGHTPDVEILDRRDPGQKFADRWPVALLETMRTTDSGAVIAVLAPRAGQASGVRCEACGEVIRCNTCHIPLPVTQVGHNTQCAWCGTPQSINSICPRCGSASLRQLRFGSEGWRDTLTAQIPQRTWRSLDQGGTSLVGTLAEYRHLPETIDLAVIPDFEGLITRPDAGVGEEVFHRLWQLLRRTTTSLHIMARDAEHPIIRALQSQRPHLFYAAELQERRDFHYPPFARLVAIRLTDIRASSAFAQATALAERLRKHAWTQKPLVISRAFSGFGTLPGGRYTAFLTLRFRQPVHSADWNSLRTLLPADAVVSVDPMHIE